MPSLVRIAVGGACALWPLLPVRAAPAAEARLWFDAPATHFTAALPLGNGRLGAMAFGGVTEERIVLNESSLWSGSRQDADRPDAHRQLAEIRRLLLAGQNVEAEQLVNAHFTCAGPGSGHGQGAHVPFGCYQVLGNLRLAFEVDTTANAATEVRGYRRELDLATATAALTYEQGGVRFRRDYFVSAPHQAIVIRLSADVPGSHSLMVRLDRPERSTTVADRAEGLLMQGTLDDGRGGAGVSYAARVRIVARGGKVSAADDDAVRVTGADEVLVLVSAATDYRGFAGRHVDDPAAATRDDLDRAVAVGYDALRTAHIADYRHWFARAALELPTTENSVLPTDRRLVAFAAGADDPALAQLYFDFGRYLLISSSRPGGLPANLQGLWAEEIQTPWNGDWHLDINVQMNYWPAEVAHLAELHEPLHKLIASLVEPGRRTARAYYDARGWVAHVITNPWGYTSPGEAASWGATVSGSAWLCQHLWEHYAYGEDREFLAWAYPIMKESALFYVDNLLEHPERGWLVTGPSNSPENGFRLPDGRSAHVCLGPAVDMQLLRELLGNVARAADVLGVDAELRDELRQRAARLAPNQIGPDGRLQEWLEPYPEVEPHHRHTSHLYGLYPGYEITRRGTPELAAACRRSLEARGERGTGWALAWRTNLWARLGDGELAYRSLRSLLQPATTGSAYDGRGAGSYPNLFCAHPPFQIDGNFGGAAGIAEMLLQSHAGEIELLPALPAAWPSGEVRGFRARGGVEIDFQWHDGQVIRYALRAQRPQTVRLRRGDLVENVQVAPVAAVASPAASAADFVQIHNGTATVGLDRRKGGAITWLSWDAYPRNAVNVADPGRLIQQSYYAGRALDRRSEGQSAAWSPWTWNPIQGGGVASWARVLEFAQPSVGELRSVTVPKLWDMPDEEAAAEMRQTVRFEPGQPRAIVVECKFAAQRASDDRWGPALPRHQEIPACYFTRNFSDVRSYLGDGQWRSERQPPGPPWGRVQPPRNAMACFNAAGQGIALFSPGATQPWNFGPHGDGASDDPAAGPCMHVAAIDEAPLGPQSRYQYRYWLVVGDAAELASALDRLHQQYGAERTAFTP